MTISTPKPQRIEKGKGATKTSANFHRRSNSNGGGIPYLSNFKGNGVGQKAMERPHHDRSPIELRTLDNATFINHLNQPVSGNQSHNQALQQHLKVGKSRTVLEDTNAGSINYQPEPDSQFFTKAKFYSAEEHQNDMISSDDNLPGMNLYSPNNDAHYSGHDQFTDNQGLYGSIMSNGAAAVPFPNGSTSSRGQRYMTVAPMHQDDKDIMMR